MAKSQGTWNKKEIEKKKQQKKKEKEARREERKASAKDGNSFEIAYVDEFGNFSATPPDPKNRVEVKEEDIQISIPKNTGPKEDPIRRGIVSFFNNSKGYGFIRDQDTQESIFVHINNTLEPIAENNRVNFEVEKGPKGPSAVNVKIAR